MGYCGICDSHGGDHVGYNLLRCDAFVAYVTSKPRRKAFELTGDSFE